MPGPDPTRAAKRSSETRATISTPTATTPAFSPGCSSIADVASGSRPSGLTHYDFLPQGDFRIVEAYARALRSARKLVYLESQFLWSPQVVDILASKLRESPSDEFRVGQYDTKFAEAFAKRT